MSLKYCESQNQCSTSFPVIGLATVRHLKIYSEISGLPGDAFAYLIIRASEFGKLFIILGRLFLVEAFLKNTKSTFPTAKTFSKLKSFTSIYLFFGLFITLSFQNCGSGASGGFDVGGVNGLQQLAQQGGPPDDITPRWFNCRGSQSKQFWRNR